MTKRASQPRPAPSDHNGETLAGTEILDLPVRVGVPIDVRGMADKVAGPSFATSVGLIKWGAKLTAPAHASNGAAAVSLQDAYRKTLRWLRDFF